MSSKNKGKQRERERQKVSVGKERKRVRILHRTPTEKRYDDNQSFILFERLGGFVARANYDFVHFIKQLGSTIWSFTILAQQKKVMCFEVFKGYNDFSENVKRA